MYSQAVQMQQNTPLAPLTTLRIGGPARYLVRIEDEAELVEAVTFARGLALPIFVLGGGSNLVVADCGFDGVVLQMAIDRPADFTDEGSHVVANVSAGQDWDSFVRGVCERGLSGVECLAGIPGLVGGTPVQNVGAYGQEVAETIVSVRALDLETMQFVSLSGSQCGFAYRASIFNTTARGRYIVTSVAFRFVRDKVPELRYADLKQHFGDARPTPMQVYHAVRAIRRGKGMLLVEGDPDCRSAGSFFKNPVLEMDRLSAVAKALSIEADAVPHWPARDGRVKLAAAWLLEKAGFHKGFARGQAGISSRHTLAIINRGEATAAEIFALRDAIQERVRQRFGVELEQEPIVLG